MVSSPDFQLTKDMGCTGKGFRVWELIIGLWCFQSKKLAHVLCIFLHSLCFLPCKSFWSKIFPYYACNKCCKRGVVTYSDQPSHHILANSTACSPSWKKVDEGWTQQVTYLSSAHREIQCNGFKTVVLTAWWICHDLQQWSLLLLQSQSRLIRASHCKPKKKFSQFKRNCNNFVPY